VLSGATDGKIVRCPVTLYVGNRDEHTADAGLQGWAAFTRGPCALQVHAPTALSHDALVG
jgi:surfactin synthase thioesterase subunit